MPTCFPARCRARATTGRDSRGCRRAPKVRVPAPLRSVIAAHMAHPSRLAAVRHYLKGYEQKQINAFATYVSPFSFPVFLGAPYDSSSTRCGAESTAGGAAGENAELLAAEFEQRREIAASSRYRRGASLLPPHKLKPSFRPCPAAVVGFVVRCGVRICATRRFNLRPRFSASKNLIAITSHKRTRQGTLHCGDFWSPETRLHGGRCAGALRGMTFSRR